MVAYLARRGSTLRVAGAPGRVVRFVARLRRAGWSTCTRGAYYYRRRKIALAAVPAP